MSLPRILRRAASCDIEEICDHLTSQHEELREEFLRRFNDVLELIGSQPELYGRIGRNVRAATLKKFPYVVYYRVSNNSIEVVAVLHGRRGPAAWQSRI